MKLSELIRVFPDVGGDIEDICPHCDKAYGATVKTDSAPTLSVTCPHCGESVMVCNSCPLRTQYHDGCDWSPNHPCSMADPVLARIAWQMYWDMEDCEK